MAVSPTPCVLEVVIKEIDSWQKAGASKDDVINRLRLRCVPHGYTPNPWSSGKLGKVPVM